MNRINIWLDFAVAMLNVLVIITIAIVVGPSAQRSQTAVDQCVLKLNTLQQRLELGISIQEGQNKVLSRQSAILEDFYESAKKAREGKDNGKRKAK